MIRRAFIGGCLAGGAGGWLSGVARGAEVASVESLDQLAKSRGLYFGCAVQIAQMKAEPDLMNAVLGECSHLTSELTLKWASIESTRGKLDFVDVDALSEFALRHDKRVRGHTLLWHLSTPYWAPAALKEPDGWDETVSRYFGSVIPRFGDVIGQWDVVNEPLELADGRDDGLRRNAFLEAFGPDYIGRALHEARKFSPTAKLTINEYNLEYDDADGRGRRLAMLKLLEALLRQGAPIDGLGLQSHLDLRKGPVSQPSLRAFLHAVTDLGLFVDVSELDVKESAYTASVAARDAQVADETRRYLETVLEAQRVGGVSTWGLSDRHSWLLVGPEDFARFPNAWRDGATPGVNRGLPYDTGMRRKPMYEAIAQSLMGRRGSAPIGT